MPTYEYECRTCGYTFEKTQNMSDDPEKTCPKCGKDVRRNIFGGAGVIFKGSGFYVNDSRGKNSASPAASSGEPKKAPAEPAAAAAKPVATEAPAGSGGKESA